MLIRCLTSNEGGLRLNIWTSDTWTSYTPPPLPYRRWNFLCKLFWTEFNHLKVPPNPNRNFSWRVLTLRRLHCRVTVSLVSSYVVCERLSVMHKQVSVYIPQTVNFCPNSPESPFLEFKTRKPPPQ